MLVCVLPNQNTKRRIFSCYFSNWLSNAFYSPNVDVSIDCFNLATFLFSSCV